MLTKAENRSAKLMRRSGQCGSILLASSKAGNGLCGVAGAVLDRKALVLAARLQEQGGLTLLHLVSII